MTAMFQVVKPWWSRERSRPPAAGWVIVELAIGAAIVYGGIRGWIAFSSNPWMVVAATVFLWWRGPGWRGVGLRRPPDLIRTIALGVGVGVAYQFFGLYVLEPLTARLTGSLPDVSVFRALVGNIWLLAFWVTMSWTLAAFMEEMVYRGWLVARIAELGKFSAAAWSGAVVVSSAIFGAIHLYQGVSGVIAAGLSGLVFGVLYLATGRNLWASILAHGALDTVGFVMMYFGVYPGL